MLSLLPGYEDAGLAIMFQSGGLRGQRECYVIFPLLTQICRNILFCKYKFYFLISAKWISKDSSCIGVSSGCWCVRPDGKMHPGPGSLGKMETVKCVYTQLSETPLSIKSSTRFFQITISSLAGDSTFLNTLTWIHFSRERLELLQWMNFKDLFRPVVVAERCSVQSGLGDPPANADVHTESEEWDN